jgi:two-component system sensor histidine kinase DesK
MDDENLRPHSFGPPWPVLPRSLGPAPFMALPHGLLSRGAVSWYIGGGLSLPWLISAVQDIAATAGSAPAAAAGISLTVVFALTFIISVPIGWSMPARWRLLPVITLFALSFALMPWLGWGVRSLWTYVGVCLGMMVLAWRTTILGIAALTLLTLVFGTLTDGFSEDDIWIAAITFSISLMMAAFANAFAALNRLRRAQDELQVMAAERERGRMARDIHDILGHSLTVITVKAELAGRLIETDPERAKAEIEEVEGLARGALSDVRATVAGYRGLTLPGELAAARVALDAASIEAQLPSGTDAVAEPHRELAAWIVREGVTNVVRHSGARRCAVRLGPRTIEIADDGVGPTGTSTPSTGLAGLRERVGAAGGTLAIGRSDLGGFSLKVIL